ncbi:hypothetical protein ACFONC_00435 [Luteimonas soli]|uniref:Uncharacterized protein n=1 Tax=Luteimonas soli TaxID=1648966 RepID=A0ABV7XH66_9GAMM
MNTPGNDRDAREWAAQERARRAAATNPPAPRGSGFSRDFFPAGERSLASPQEAGDAAYRHVADALRRPPPVELPPDFAARVARIAELQTATAVTKSSRLKPLPRSSAFERRLTGALVAVFALGTAAAALVYGARVMAQLEALAGVQGLQWLALLAGCLGLSWSLGWLRRQAGHDGIARPG